MVGNMFTIWLNVSRRFNEIRHKVNRQLYKTALLFNAARRSFVYYTI